MKTLITIASFLSTLFFVSGCAFHRAEVLDQKILANKKIVFIYGLEDPLEIKESVSDGLINLGFKVTENKAEAELIADYKHRCYWDVIHYTCSEINFFLTDPKTKKLVLKSRFLGDTLYTPKTLVADMFKKVGKELQENAVQPLISPPGVNRKH